MSYRSSGYYSSGYYSSGYYGDSTPAIITANYFFSIIGIIDPDGLEMRGKIWE